MDRTTGGGGLIWENENIEEGGGKKLNKRMVSLKSRIFGKSKEKFRALS
jgi:hypothetical protein